MDELKEFERRFDHIVKELNSSSGDFSKAIFEAREAFKRITAGYSKDDPSGPSGKGFSAFKKRIEYKLELLEAVSDREWEAKRLGISGKIRSSSLAPKVFEAASVSMSGRRWYEEITKPSFVCDVQGQSDGEVDRAYRLRAFAAIFCATVMGEDVRVIVTSRLVSTSLEVARAATTFARLEMGGALSSETLLDAIRFPLHEVFAFSPRSALERDAFLGPRLLLEMAQSDRLSTACRPQTAHTAFMIASTLPLDDSSQARIITSAAILSKMSPSEVIGHIRAVCAGKPVHWHTECITVLLNAHPDKISSLWLTPEELGALRQSERAKQYIRRHAALAGNLTDLRTVSSAPSGIGRAVPMELVADTERARKLQRLLNSTSLSTSKEDKKGQHHELLEMVVKQPALQLMSAAPPPLSSKENDPAGTRNAAPSSAMTFASKIKMATGGKSMPISTPLTTLDKLSSSAAVAAPLMAPSGSSIESAPSQPSGAAAFRERVRRAAAVKS